MIIVVADAFSEDYIGGAELTTDALLSYGFNNYKKIHSHNLTITQVKTLCNEKWVFGNFSGIHKSVLLEIVKTVKDYSVIEYDYKFCIYRLESKHIKISGACDCATSPHGKLVGLFYAKAKNLFFMSLNQKQEYKKKFPFLEKVESPVLSSMFSKTTLEHINSLDISNKNDKYVILQSSSWVKGTSECVEFAKKNKLDYELVGGISHKKMLKKLASSRGLIFLPSGYDTCPRITIEAKLLECELILNENVQHKNEPWFQKKEKILPYLEKQRKLFYKKCLDYNLSKYKSTGKTKFHFIIPGYNAAKWLPHCFETILRQEYTNYTVTFIDDLSTDHSCQVFQNQCFSDPRFKIIRNETKKYALRNIEQAITSLDAFSEDVIILLDADDWLSSKSVLSYLDNVYDSGEVLATYGSYMYYPYGDRGVEPSAYPPNTIKNNSYRHDPWRASHLRTFRKKVWDEINKEDFVDIGGDYYHMAYDQAIMLPILEMSGDRAVFIDKILHVYNRANPLNVDKQKQLQQYNTMKRIRAKLVYERKRF
tara:strand:- start:8304 stop:9914 length:1611 start_codon:yes stop_codon:yes gene_type:complete